jgi:predicted O-methyltransferase YrrM
MSQAEWTAVESFFDDKLLYVDDALTLAHADQEAGGLPPISVTPSQGALLKLLASSLRARRILEVGTLGGYSTIWLARSLPDDGVLVTCELDPHHAEVAAANLERAGLSDFVEIMEGPAIDSLRTLITEGVEPFDFVFIDADKPSNADYVTAAVELSHPGTVIVVDNVARNGGVVADQPDDNSLGVHRLVGLVAEHPRLESTVIQTVGSKGWDGFMYAVVQP